MESTDSYWDNSFLAAEEDKTMSSYGYQSIDYTVLSVAVATLGLVIFVELIRHKVDHLATGRPFFTELITCVNSELATLGIVEFVLFIIQKYYDGLNKEQKQVFADVHFMLFYCALFNALESAILAITVFWVTERTWVRTELLNFDHYSEIREEFERVDAILYGEHHDATEFVFEYNVLGFMLGLKKLWQRVYRLVRYPILSRRRSELLVQVRFHDLRVHFLKDNNLPLQLQVSDYLKRSLVKTLKRLVHISAVAWLLLTGVINVVYFLMGIVVYVTGDVGVVGYSLTWIFLSSMVFFVLLSLVIYNKINWIFRRITQMKLIDESSNSNFKSGMSICKGEEEVKSQSDLFWGGNPSYITVAIQFSQFGFALALSILLVFWDDINVKGNPVPIYAYTVTAFACYGAFVLIMAEVIPRYTMCTSLGHLVNKKHLNETLAEHHLKEAQRKRQQLLDEQDDVLFETEESSGNARLSDRSKTAEKPALLADLVQADTHALRSSLPVEHSDQTQRIERTRRRKTASDGVAPMRQMSGTQILPARLVRQKSKSLSAAIQQMKDAEHDVARPMQKSSSGSSMTGISESLVFAGVGYAEDQPLVDQAPTSCSLPRRVKIPSSSASSIPPFPEETTVEVIELPAALPQLENASDSNDGSDISDIPNIDNDDDIAQASEPEKHQTLYDAVRDYFLGPNYPVVSAVFGTLGVFFVIGQRIEGLLLATGALPNLKNTYQFRPVVSFWWETAYLCCFIGASTFISIIFGPGRASTNRTRSLFLAGVLDVVLSGSCLALLMIAEAQRCVCAEGDEATADCCAPFGSRTDGGVGNIEPITSIIMFRLFRFAFAQRFVKFLGKRIEWPNTGVTHEMNHHGHHGGHSAGPQNAIVVIWQAAVSMYPDVVEEHGEFSSELLQAMLGIGIVEDPPKHAVSAVHQDESVNVDVSSENESVKASQNAGQQATTADEKPSSFSFETRTVSVDVGGQVHGSVSSLVVAPKTPLEYKLGPSDEEMDEVPFSFIYPRAKLVRSMRRCDRKLLPLIDRWTVADLVVTKHEIVFFDASDVDEPSSTKYSPEALRAMEMTRQALSATKGGKGLQLRHVAAGRKVVGHIAISAIDSVLVERRLPNVEDAELLDAEEHIERPDEFWESNKKTANAHDHRCREARWAKLKEDHLLIHSAYGTLCFRFYSDLEDAEVHRDRCLSERENSESLFKNTALLWCQTVVRLCKRTQLKQKLDHYGDGDDAELRDYLRVVGPKNEVHYRLLGNLRGRARDFRRGDSQRNIVKSNRVETASVHPGDTSFRIDDCEFVDVL